MSASGAAFAPQASSTGAPPAYACAPVDECMPCPEDHLAYPYCRPYNNRQAVQCLASDGALVDGWSACGKFIGAEVRHYGQFVFLNVLLVVAALSVYVWRQVYQTRKFHGMLYHRVHGRQTRRAPAMQN
ncbi:uncharacterized protein MJAP1_000040 [Malassezia japonica]|uniref:Uncharacterized protein n=1 Tax=Malassezia japonica TaxID=223818 RepID=A0AAF0EZ44_9BASI|nr:uncharacterized protein MJAP1_000040 [Malassezia japonica]WFD37099.1 hypothetical protein MJAP1_000040 [Malassezia japonica]